jgi:hypothetical protein
MLGHVLLVGFVVLVEFVLHYLWARQEKQDEDLELRGEDRGSKKAV